MKGIRNMSDNKNVSLTEEDKKTIDALRVAPLLKIFNIARKKKVENILSIEDLSIENLKDLLPKIDLYVKELFSMRVGLDEIWVAEYYSLKASINKRLECS
jgi:hypothetical protein